jgi:tetratricopeptide (TPR) repeat protein/glycosyltransferase involved in cell wall biosynthesis
MKIALALIVKPDEGEAILLDRCLDSVEKYVDGIFITQAGKAPHPRVSKVIKAHKGVESFWEWNDSFADARNFNFSQVPKEYEYILWLDADDVIRNPEKIKPTLEANPSIDVFSLWYLYAFDEWKNPVVVHHKNRIVKNDGCVRWVGDLHEDFTENRNIERKHVEGIEVLHLTNIDRINVAKTRNEHVAEVHHERNPDDPRSYWVLGNSQKAVGKDTEAIASFEKFLELSLSDDEKYIARLRIAEAYLGIDQKIKAVDSLRYAIGLKPLYPDAYIALGRLYYDLGQYADAISLLKQSLVLKPPYYSIVVYNPRDYDYTPLKWLGYSYSAINQPMLAFECFKQLLEITPQDEKLRKVVENMEEVATKHGKVLEEYARIKNLKGDELKKALDAIPEDFKAAPEFTNLRNLNFIKKESSGKDLVILCGYTVRQWDGRAVTEGIGGSEEAVIHLAEKFTSAGWNVTVYNNCGHKDIEVRGVTYKPFWTWNFRDKQDVTILWRHAKMADYEINSTKVFIDLHDVILPGEFTEKRLARIDRIFVKSQFHRDLFPKVPDEKFAIIPNGIVSATFEEKLERDPYLMINTSSPDRSLSTLIRLFKRVKEQVPEAKLEWAYGWGTFDAVHGNNPKVMEWKQSMITAMEQLGIVNRGLVSHEEVARMYKRARIFAYPTEFAEIDCISARKAQSGGAIPVTTDFAALNETVHYGYKVHSKKDSTNWCLPYQYDFALNDTKAEDEWVQHCVDILKNKPTKGNEQNIPEMREWTKQFDWSIIANRWMKYFT